METGKKTFCRKAISMGHFYVRSFVSPSDAIRQFDDHHVRLFRQFGADEMQLVLIVLYVCVSISVSGVTSNEMSFTRIAVCLNYFWFQFHIQNINVCVSVCTSNFISQINWSGDLDFFLLSLLWKKGKWKMKWIQLFIEARFLQLNHLFEVENSKFVYICFRGKRTRIWCFYFVYHIHNWHHT